jgi:hypothetical protein
VIRPAPQDEKETTDEAKTRKSPQQFFLQE